MLAGIIPAAPRTGSTMTAARLAASRSITSAAPSGSLNGNSTTSCATPWVTPGGT